MYAVGLQCFLECSWCAADLQRPGASADQRRALMTVMPKLGLRIVAAIRMFRASITRTLLRPAGAGRVLCAHTVASHMERTKGKSGQGEGAIDGYASASLLLGDAANKAGDKSAIGA